MRPILKSAPPYRALCHPNLASTQAADWLRDPRRLLPRGVEAPWRGLTPCGRWFVKYREVSRLAALRPGSSDRFTRTMPLGLKLEVQRQPISIPLALIEGPGVVGRGQGRWLMMDAVSGLNLAQFVAESPLDASLAILGKLAQALAQFHDRGFRQRDLKAPNVMVGEGGELVLVDLEGMRALDGPAHWKLRAKDLGRLAASFQSPAFLKAGFLPEHWDELLRLYIDSCEGTAWTREALSEQTLRYARRKVAKNMAAGRPLA